MIAPSRVRLAFVGSALVAITAAACGTIADLDVKYDGVSATVVDSGGPVDSSNIDGGSRVIRDGSFVEPDAPEPPVLDPSDAGPCGVDSDDGGGCDFAQGLGCCLLPTKDSRCIYQWEIADKCKNGLFIGCRGDAVNSESACCLRDGPVGSFAKMTVLSVSCDGGPHACTTFDGGPGCAGGAFCAAKVCPIDGGDFEIGTCVSDEVSCP